MKKIVLKLLGWDAPEKSVLFAVALMIFGGWIWLNFVALLGGMPQVCFGINGGSLNLWSSSLVLLIIFFLYLLLCGWGFGWKYRGELTFLKRWKWQLPTTIGLILFLAALIQAVEVLLIWEGSVQTEDADGFITLFPGIVGVIVAYFGFAALIAVFFCSAKLISNASKVPLRQLFGKRVIAVLVLFILSFVSFSLLAIRAGNKADKQLESAAELFGRAISPEALKELYLAEREENPEFWKRVAQYFLDTDELAEGKFKPLLADPQGKFSAEEMAELQKELNSNAKIKAWERLFSSEIPPLSRRYMKYELLSMPLPELHVFQRFCAIEYWRIRFAVANKDHRAALAAVSRMENVRNALKNDHLLLAVIQFEKCEKLRLDALTVMLDNFSLSPVYLEDWRQKEEQHREELPEITARVMFSELVTMLDWCDAFCNGEFYSDTFDEKAPSQRMYRWLLPGLWASLNNARMQYIAAFDKSAGVTADKLSSSFPKDSVYRVLPEAYRSLASRMDSLHRRYEELEKRCR